MPSVLPGYQYDVFISYRQKDNKYDNWVTEFVSNLRKEIEATFKEEINIYFDESPKDGLLESHTVDKSLESKLKCLIFIPILSHTYCDPNSFAWQHEFLSFIKLAGQDKHGLDVELPSGNFASRILPVRIHEIDAEDQNLFEAESGNKLRSIDFIYKASGVNRPLLSNEDDPKANQYNISYRDQINKVTNAVKDIIQAMKSGKSEEVVVENMSDSSKAGFTAEVEKRDLLRVSLVYIILALVSWKISILVTPWLNLPAVIPNVVGITLAVFFPIALYLAWNFERGPGGFVKVGSQASMENPLSRRQRKPLTNNSLILILILLMVGLYAFFPNRGLQYGSSGGSAISEEDRSIAVLYFDNMSGDPEQEYFSDGITEEIIARLAKVEGMKVISRTSVRAYKGQPLNLKKIAGELGVAYVLEGSVRKAGNTVRITAQLINAETDEHIWAESFDRELTQVLKIQAELAEAIVNMFEIEISPETNMKVSDIATQSSEAYESYLKARYIAFNEYYYIGDSSAFERSRALYEEAIKLDPMFAEAYAGLADLYDATPPGQRTPEKDSLRRNLSKKAYELDPNSAFANNVRIWTLINWRSDPQFDSAVYHAAKAVYLEPADFYNQSSLGSALLQAGQAELAIPYLEKAVELNPLDASSLNSTGLAHWILDDKEKANLYFQKIVQLPEQKIFPAIATFLFWLIANDEDEVAVQIKAEIEEKIGRNLGRVTRVLKVKEGKVDEVREEVKDFQGRNNQLFYSALLGDTSEFITALTEVPPNALRYYSFNVWPFNLYRNFPEAQDFISRRKQLIDEERSKYKRIIDRVMRGDLPY